MKKLRVFDIFTSALKDFETGDKDLYSWPRNRLALTHALAQRLFSAVNKDNPSLFVDMSPNPDIMVHNRKGQVSLAVMCRNDYLTEGEQKNLMKLAETASLAMAVSFFPQKRYMLLYRATSSSIEYFHFDRNTLTAEALKKKTFEKKADKGAGQAYLSL